MISTIFLGYSSIDYYGVVVDKITPFGQPIPNSRQRTVFRELTAADPGWRLADALGEPTMNVSG
jgi:hypothetical protein